MKRSRSGPSGSVFSLLIALITALVNQDKGAAIRLLRERAGLDIGEAKKAVDTLPFRGTDPKGMDPKGMDPKGINPLGMNSHSDLAPGEVPRTNGTVWLIVLAVVVYVAYQILVVPD